MRAHCGRDGSRPRGRARCADRAHHLVRPSFRRAPMTWRAKRRRARFERLADAAGELMTGLKQGLAADEHHRIQEGIGDAVMRLDLVGAEADRERVVRLSPAPETGPLCARCSDYATTSCSSAARPLHPCRKLCRRNSSLAAMSARLSLSFFRATAAALVARRRPPCLDGVESALHSYAAAIDRVRQDGLTRCLPSEVTERFFALCFALEQLRHNLRDLKGCVAEWEQSARRTSKL